MDLALAIAQGIGLALACGIRPFLPALLAGALASANLGLDFGGTDFVFLERSWFLLAVVVLLVVVVTLVATAIGGPSIIGFGLAAVHLAVAALVTWLSAYRYPGRLQLWVKRGGGQQVLLFSSADQTEFHKVRRALERAVEYHRELAA